MIFPTHPFFETFSVVDFTPFVTTTPRIAVMAVWLRACAISYLPNHARMYEHHTQPMALTMMAVVIRFV